MRPLRILPYCGCQLGSALSPLANDGTLSISTDAIGIMKYATYTTSEMLQQIRFVRGEIEVPQFLRYYCYLPETLPAGAPEMRKIEEADIVLIEPNTTLDIFFGPYALHRSAILIAILNKLKDVNSDANAAINAWFYKGIWGRDRKVQREAATVLIPLLTGRVDNPALARQLLLECRGEEQDFDHYLRGMSELADIVHLPLGLVSFVYQFLPDGRPLGWPADFIENTFKAAQALNIPVFDSASLVLRHGISTALDSEQRLYRPEFTPVAGKAVLQFCHSVLEHGNSSSTSLG